MINQNLVKNYATALFSWAKDVGAENKVLDQLTIMSEAIFGDPAIKETLCSPIVNNNFKIKTIESVTKKFNLHNLVGDFLLLLIKNSRMAILPFIITLYRQLLEESNNIKMIQVTSAKILQTEEQDWVRNYLEEDLKQEVAINFNQDESIIGGLIIQYGSIVEDYSIAGTLEKIGKTLKNTNVNLVVKSGENR